MFLVEEVVKKRLAPRSHPATRRTSIDGFQRIRPMEAEHAVEPSDRGATQSRKSAEEGNEGHEGDEQDAHEDLLVCLHSQLRLMMLRFAAGSSMGYVPSLTLLWVRRKKSELFPSLYWKLR